MNCRIRATLNQFQVSGPSNQDKQSSIAPSSGRKEKPSQSFWWITLYQLHVIPPFIDGAQTFFVYLFCT
ncbi:hypothetical protein KUCAC02_016076 [Chaenocephalus aceratus]|uniref:Uncharacterized protein n=1 Tax=Chaenocephalus aceratus TaxID=36190 RepID=A0ACB9XZG6_CHAAC|nr:hypothetical protein KUCAC02_016076 [Chaenocephalus aceratus]